MEKFFQGPLFSLNIGIPRFQELFWRKNWRQVRRQEKHIFLSTKIALVFEEIGSQEVSPIFSKLFEIWAGNFVAVFSVPVRHLKGPVLKFREKRLSEKDYTRLKGFRRQSRPKKESAKNNNHSGGAKK